MKEENKLALIVAFYISKFDNEAYKKLNFGNQNATHKAIGEILNVKASTIQNMRDEFDPIHDNHRKGWHQKPLSPSRQEVVSKFRKYEEKLLFNFVQTILNPQKNNFEIFNEVEKEEIDLHQQDIIEGETIERKVLSYKRNAKNANLCKIRDNFTCQTCNFWYHNQIVECHHIEPLSMIKQSIINSEKLITLCPTCHRVAHNLIRTNYTKYTKKEILIASIKQIMEDLKSRVQINPKT